LFECGPCLVGANQRTSLETVKTVSGVSEERVRELIAQARTKEKEVDATDEDEESDEVEPLTDAEIVAVRELLADRAENQETSQDEKATPTPPADDEEPAGAKSAQPVENGTAALAAAQLQLMEMSIIEETV